jgi:hypothetical protein
MLVGDKGSTKGRELHTPPLEEVCKIQEGIRCPPELTCCFDTRALQMDLYVDGNIAQMFSPEGATRYFGRFLGIDVRSLRPTVSQEPPHPFIITTSATQNACPYLAINERPLDYAISQAGTIVPQRMWSPANPADAQHFPNISLNMPIFFLHDDRVTLGLPLLKALEGDRAILQGADDTAPVGSCSTMYIRINASTFCPSMIAHICLEVVLLKLDFSGRVMVIGIRRS